MAGLFASDSVIRRVNIEPAVLLGAGRALLLQLSHPAVAQGVEDHSEFRKNPFTRLQGTLEATYAVVFGPEDVARGVGRRIQWVHDHVTGPTYRANDPANLMWVHATLMDTALGCYLDFVGPLSDADAETYYREMMVVADVFGVPLEVQPPSLAAFRDYFDAAVAGMQVSDTGRDLARYILDPTLPLGLHVPLRPLVGLQRRLTIGRLPGSLREQFGYAWGQHEQARLDRTVRRLRSVSRAMPRSVRTAGPRVQGRYLLWLARRHVRRFEARRPSAVGHAA